MEFREILTESSLTLTVNKVRTGLAMLGVIIGIGSVIALMSLGQASQKSIMERISALGSNLLTVMPGSVQNNGVRGTVGGRESLTMEDAEAIAKEVHLVTAVSPVISGNAQIVAGRNNSNTSVYGVKPEYAQVNNITISLGTFIMENHVVGISRVAVLGPDVVTDLFGENSNPIGQSIRVNGQSLKVIGVTESKGGSGMGNQDSVVYVPLSVAQIILFGQSYLSSLGLSVVNEQSMTLAQNQVENLLLRRHKISNPEKADFRIMNQEELISTVSEVTGTFTALLSGIAAISLVVGGIGIMNIMLVTVTERTREIGLRKALGAKKKHITIQFLLETIMITFTGGVVGIGVGMVTSYILSSIMGLVFTLSLSSILLAFVVSVLTGVIFGWYPAKTASDLQPIEALRYE